MKLLSSRLALMLVLSVSLISWSVVQAEQEKEMMSQVSQPAMIMTTPSDITWADVPPELPPGAKIAVLEGDPYKPEP